MRTMRIGLEPTGLNLQNASLNSSHHKRYNDSKIVCYGASNYQNNNIDSGNNPVYR